MLARLHCLHSVDPENRTVSVEHSSLSFRTKLRQHLLENLDDNPADGTERPPVKKKISFAHLYIM